MDVLRHIGDAVSDDVEADHVGEEKSGGLRPADGLSGEGVNLLDGEIHGLHQAHDVEHGKNADTVANKVGRVLGADYAFAEVDVAKLGDFGDGGLIGFWSWNDFQQAHVPRRVEEVRPKPVAPKIVRETFGNFCNRKTARVGGNDGARPAMDVNFAE